MARGPRLRGSHVSELCLLVCCLMKKSECCQQVWISAPEVNARLLSSRDSSICVLISGQTGSKLITVYRANWRRSQGSEICWLPCRGVSRDARKDGEGRVDTADVNRNACVALKCSVQIRLSTNRDCVGSCSQNGGGGGTTQQILQPLV